jgi:hypothetical protein
VRKYGFESDSATLVQQLGTSLCDPVCRFSNGR